MPTKILILAGTNDARLLANRLVENRFDVTSSFAGVTENPILPLGKIRVGGFGGTDGMREYLVANKFDVLIDATHPFAAQISKNAANAWPHLMRLERAAWVSSQSDNWINVPDIAAANRSLPFGARVFLTIGRKEILPFIDRSDLSGVVRMIECPPSNLPQKWELVRERPPFRLEQEILLMQTRHISHLVTKNSGGDLASHKLAAARNLGLPVIMIERPLKPAAQIFQSIDAIAAELASRYT